jgi:hypothetical protein
MTPSGFNDSTGTRSLAQRLCVFLTAALLAGVVGCGPSGTSSTGASTGAAKGSAATSEVEVARVLEELTQSVRKFSVEQRQAPRNLEDLVAKGYLDRVPPAPDGRQFVITKNLQVQLANR